MGSISPIKCIKCLAQVHNAVPPVILDQVTPQYLLQFMRVLCSNCSYFIFIYCHFHFCCHSECIAHLEKVKSINECMRTSYCVELLNIKSNTLQTNMVKLNE